MAQLSLKEQRELQKLIKQNEVIQNRINEGVKVQSKTLEKQEQIQKRILDLETKRDAMSQEQRDVLKESNKLLEQMDKKERVLVLSADKFKSMKSKTLKLTQDILSESVKANKAGKLSNTLLQTQTDLMSDILNSAVDLESIKAMEHDLQSELNKAMEEGNEELGDHYALALKVLKAKEEEVEHIRDSDDAMSGLDDLMGGFLKSSMEFLSASPIAKGIAAATVLMAQLNKGLQQFSEVAGKIGEQLGASMLKDFGPQLGMASAKATSLGYGMDEVLTVTQNLVNEFGLTNAEALKVQGTILNISKATGVSVENGTKLITMFGTLSGKSAESAENMVSFINEMSMVEGISPNAVLDDIANNAEFFAKYAKDGGQNIAITAMNARKLGLSLSTIEGMMQGQTDIASMLNAEREAELFLNKDINAEKLFAARLEGDTATVMAETLRLAGSKAEFDELMPIAKQKLAALLQMEVSELQKIVDQEDRRKKLIAGTLPLAKQTFKELVGEDALDGLQKFNNSLAEIGAVLVQTLIPPIATVLGMLGDMFNKLSENEGMMAVVSGVVTSLAVALGMLAIKGVVAAVSMAWSALAAMGTATLGFGLAAAIPIGLAFAAGAFGSLSKAKEGGDMISPASGQTMISTKEGGLFKMSPNDDILAAPGLANAMTSGGTQVNMKPVKDEITLLKTEMAKTNAAMNTLISNMEGYFGFGGTAVKGIGRETIKAGTSLV